MRRLLSAAILLVTNSLAYLAIAALATAPASARMLTVAGLLSIGASALLSRVCRQNTLRVVGWTLAAFCLGLMVHPPSSMPRAERLEAMQHHPFGESALCWCLLLAFAGSLIGLYLRDIRAALNRVNEGREA